MNKAMLKKYGSKLSLLFLVAVLLFLASGCSANAAQPTQAQSAQQSAPQSDQSAFAWSIQVKKTEYTEDMKASKNMLQYSGNTTSVNIEKKPGSGNIFVLIDLEIDKQAMGASQFDWKKLYLVDGTGQKYYRMDNDTFLEDFHYNRIKSINLTLGNNEGFACFEIKKESQRGSLTLVFDATEGQDRIKLQ